VLERIGQGGMGVVYAAIDLGDAVTTERAHAEALRRRIIIE
jgi:hypothetical protein